MKIKKAALPVEQRFRARSKRRKRLTFSLRTRLRTATSGNSRSVGSGVVETLGIPKHQFTLVATQRIHKFWVNFDFLASSSYLAPIFSNTTFNSYVFRFKGNRRGDLTAGYTFGWKQDRLNLRLFGTIENFFDDRYFENGFRTPGRNGRVGLSFGF